MSFLDGLVGGGILSGIGDVVGAISSSNAAADQLQGAREARSDIQQYTGQAAGYQQPTYNTGMQNYQTLSGMVNGGGYNTQPYNYQDQGFNFQQDPGYQWQLQQGNNAIQSNAAAGGMQLSGATQKALMKYGQGLANQTYQQAYERYNTNRNFGMQNAMNQFQTGLAGNQQGYNMRMGLAEPGIQAGNNLSNIYSQAGQQVADTSYNMGNARAAGAMGVGQSIGNMFGNAGSMATLYGMFGGQNQGNGQSNDPFQSINNTYGGISRY